MAKKKESSSRAGWLLYPLHLLLATLGVGFAANISTHLLTIPTRAEHLLIGIPYFPVQITLALSVGFLLDFWLLQRSAAWVWVVPLAVLAASFWLSALPLPARIAEYFGWGCRPELRCFVQSGITAPFYASAAYSIGALVALRSRIPGRPTPREPANATH